MEDQLGGRAPVSRFPAKLLHPTVKTSPFTDVLSRGLSLGLFYDGWDGPRHKFNRTVLVLSANRAVQVRPALYSSI
jgi:hypothetical protein